MTKRMIIAALLVAGLTVTLWPRRVEADPVPELTRFLNEQIYYISEASKNGGLGDLRNATDPAIFAKEYDFSGAWLRLQASVAFTVPGIATVSVLPTVELIWE